MFLETTILCKGTIVSLCILYIELYFNGRNIFWRVVKSTPYGNMIIGMVCFRCPSAPMGSLFTLLPCIHPYHYDGLKRYLCGRSHKIPLPLSHITFNHFLWLSLKALVRGGGTPLVHNNIIFLSFKKLACRKC